MQKKLIALAIAGLMSAPAFAQSNVTLYGTIDYGFTSLGGTDDVWDSGKKIKARNAIDSGISKANRIGFKGTEDLGNGLKAVFVLEEGLNGDQGSMFKTVNRQSYAGLAGGFGTVAFGRHYTPQHLFTSAVDPFGKNGLGSAGNVLIQERRLNNLLAYISPSFGGFSFIAGYSFNGTGPVTIFQGIPVAPGTPYPTVGGGDENYGNAGDIRTWAIAPSFTWNNLFVGANYHNARITGLGQLGLDRSSINALDVYEMYASYDFGFVKLGATFGRRITKKTAIDAVTGALLVSPLIPSADNNSRVTQWMVGATFKITPSDSILTSYSRASENKVWDGQDGRPRISQWAIGYEHALSKRTALYAQYAAQSHNNYYKDYGFVSLVTDGPVGYVGASNLGSNSDAYRRGFAIGFRHDF
ncbi:MAG: porin [Betaproteobacteria bacterium]|nr:porin [Betaproteobacteria bacterium]